MTHKRLQADKSLFVKITYIVALIAIIVIGVNIFGRSRAATPFLSAQPESGNISAPATSVSDATASGSRAIRFTSATSTGNTSVKPLSNIGCNYGDDTWSGDATNVGYTVTKLSASNGNPASFSVKMNARVGTTEVVGYPSVQCILYAAVPANFASAFDTSPPPGSSGLDYEYAYDIWMTTAAKAQVNNWSGDLELMIWTYTNGQVPLGSIKATLNDGSKVWIYGSNTTGTISVVMPNTLKGVADISGILTQLKSLGYLSSTYDGILSAEYGVEAPYGGGQTFTVNSLSMGTKQ